MTRQWGAEHNAVVAHDIQAQKEQHHAGAAAIAFCADAKKRQGTEFYSYSTQFRPRMPWNTSSWGSFSRGQSCIVLVQPVRQTAGWTLCHASFYPKFSTLVRTMQQSILCVDAGIPIWATKYIRKKLGYGAGNVLGMMAQY